MRALRFCSAPSWESSSSYQRGELALLRLYKLLKVGGRGGNSAPSSLPGTEAAHTNLLEAAILSVAK